MLISPQEAIYFGNNTFWGEGAGSGPWIMADLENGLFSGSNPGENDNDPTMTFRFVTAIVKGRPNHWAIRGGDATSGGLSSIYPAFDPLQTFQLHKMSIRYQSEIWRDIMLTSRSLLQRSSTQRARIQPHEQGGCHYSGYWR